MLLQKEVDISPGDTVGSLYFDKLFPLGVEAMVESVDMVAGGNAPSLVQDESQATYEGWCRKEDVTIDWSLPLDEIYNLVRGGDPSTRRSHKSPGQGASAFPRSKAGRRSRRRTWRSG